MSKQQQQTSPTSSMELPYARNLESGGVPRATSSSLTFSRAWLKHIARETLQIGENGYYVNSQGETVSVKDDLRQAIDHSVHYHSTHVFTQPQEPGNYPTEFRVEYGSSLQVADQLEQQCKPNDSHPHIGILNSASAKTPSKFLRGTISQEEGLCRASLLYHCLVQFELLPHHYYSINNKEKYQANPSACAIFSPHVPVIRHDTVQGPLLDHSTLRSFVSIPAANAFAVGRQEHEHNIPKAQQPGALDAGVPYEHETLWEAMHDRIARVLCLFQQHGCTHLVLCAFGCGVHGNNPETVARIFRQLLLETTLRGHFATVVFAIQPSRTGNYAAFTKIFPEAITTSAAS